MLKKATIFVTITAAIVTIVCVAIVIYLEYLEKATIEKVILDLVIAVFPVFLSVLLINILIEKVFEREKQRDWEFIHLYLAEKILSTAIQAFNTLPVLYNFWSEHDITRELSEVEKYVILENFTKFENTRTFYSLYLSRFIHSLETEQFKRY